MSDRPIKTFDLKFRGIDDFNRPVYKVVGKRIYFGSVTTLFPNKEIAPNNDAEEINSYFRDNIEEIEFFGDKFNCEPHGGRADNWRFNITDN